MSGAIAQFVIPGLSVVGEEREFARLAAKCSDTVERMALQPVKADNNDQPGTLISIAFHYVPDGDDGPTGRAETLGRLLIQRFVGMLSFAFGQRIGAVHQQIVKVRHNGQMSVGLHPERKSYGPIKVELSDALMSAKPSDATFDALFWLRRGLNEADHLDAFAALMVCLEVLARAHMPMEMQVHRCGSCGEEVGRRSTAPVRVLLTQLGATIEQCERMLRARNAVVAHGNESVTSPVIQDVVELKFDAAVFAFKGLKLSLGLPINGPPHPGQPFFMTDTFLSAS
jgi:hypothetical protein